MADDCLPTSVDSHGEEGTNYMTPDGIRSVTDLCSDKGISL